MLKKIYILCFFVLQLAIVNGQNNFFYNGQVVDKNGDGIPFAHIETQFEEIFRCDIDGFFKLSSSKNSSTILISAIGYNEKLVKLSTSSELLITMEENNKFLDELVISGTLQLIKRKDSPILVDVYNSSYLKKIPSPSLVESTDQIAGVRPQLNCAVCNTGDIHINGMEGSYAMVVIDGMPLMGGLSTVYGLQGIPTSLIHQLEVVKGPASTLYGSEAMAGLINVITKDVSCLPNLSIDFNISSWGEFQGSALFKMLNKKRVKSFTTFDVLKYANPKDNNGDNFTDLALKNRYSVFNKFYIYPKSTQKNPFNISLRYMHEDRWGGQMNWDETYRGSNEIYGESILTNRFEAYSSYHIPFAKQLIWKNSYSWHNQQSWYGITSYNAKQVIGFSQLTWHKDLGQKNKLLTGLALRYNLYDDNTPATVIANEWWLPGFFVQDQLSFNDKNKVLLGWRTDLHSKHGVINSPRFNYQHSFSDKTTLRFGLGNGFRVVNVFTEDHAALTGAREVIFNESLLPERSKNANINISTDQKTTFFDFHAEGSMFYTHFSNKIIPDFETNDNQIIYSNLDGYSVSKGLSLQVGLQCKEIPLKLNANGTLLDVGVFNYDENNNVIKTQQLLSEQNSFKYNIAYELIKWGIQLDYTASRYGPIRLPLLENDFRPAHSSPYSIHNIKLTKNFSNRRSLYLGVRNLFNFTPPNYSILRAHDPFDQYVDDEIDNPNGYTFDASYMYASFQGINIIFGGSFVF